MFTDTATVVRVYVKIGQSTQCLLAANPETLARLLATGRVEKVEVNDSTPEWVIDTVLSTELTDKEIQ